MATTIIPTAPDTVTDCEVPERETDVLRVGGLVLKQTQELDYVYSWGRLVLIGPDRGSVLLQKHVQRETWMASIAWEHHFSGSVKTTSVHVTPEGALSTARALGNFPEEFWQALATEP